ncbi:MAG TPA: hypothetical protein VMS17_12555 [Gemmataceae bacterium]|nr:hypothetical protein [Gemmataceae bacterium]
MSKLKSWAARAARSLSHHLDRLRETLTRLHGRLREAVTEAVSGSAAATVRDAVLAAMLAPEATPTYASPNYGSSSRPYDQHRYRDGPYWSDDPYRPSWDRDPYEDDPDDYNRDEAGDSTPNHTPTPSQPIGRIGQAIVMGCQAAAWWLRRKTASRYAAITALGVGAAAGLTAFYFGPFVAAAAALAGSTLGLTATAEAMRRGAALLLGAGSS